MTQHNPNGQYLTAWLVRKSIADIAESGNWRSYEGKKLESVSKNLRESFARKHVRLCSSGTLGIELAVRSLKLPPDSEVLLSAYDYPGNFRAIEDAGAKVALCDVQKGDWVPGVEQLEKAIGEKTRAIVISHLHGSIAPVHDICKWAKERSLFVIEDVCQEIGGSIEMEQASMPLGSFGDLSVLSFGGSKLVSAGRGGAVMTNDDQLSQRMTVYCTRGNDAYALSELQAAVLHPQLSQLPFDSERRRRAALQLIETIEPLRWIRATEIRPFALPAYYKVGFQLNEECRKLASVQELVCKANTTMAELRDAIVNMLSSAKIVIGEGFRGFSHRSASRCRRPASLENAITAAESTMVLHHSHLLDPETGASSIDLVAKILRDIG